MDVAHVCQRVMNIVCIVQVYFVEKNVLKSGKNIKMAVKIKCYKSFLNGIKCGLEMARGDGVTGTYIQDNDIIWNNRKVEFADVIRFDKNNFIKKRIIKHDT